MVALRLWSGAKLPSVALIVAIDWQSTACRTNDRRCLGWQTGVLSWHATSREVGRFRDVSYIAFHVQNDDSYTLTSVRIPSTFSLPSLPSVLLEVGPPSPFLPPFRSSPHILAHFRHKFAPFCLFTDGGGVAQW